MEQREWNGRGKGIKAMKRRRAHGYALNETGAVAPLVGIMIFLFIGCLALVVDLGMLHNVKVQLQRAADAAALAGAQQLDTGSDQDSRAEDAAKATAATNKVQGTTGFLSGTSGWVDDNSVTVEVGHWDPDVSATDRFTFPVDPNTGNAVKVTATIEVPLIFARIFGNTSSTVSADAIAVAARQIAETLGLSAMVCWTTSGATALRVARERPEMAIVCAIPGMPPSPPVPCSPSAAERDVRAPRAISST